MVAAITACVLLGFGAAPALAWDARTIEGTTAERNNTHTSPPPSPNICSHGAPDSVPGLYDFSWACYAHDVCYQNHQLNGIRRTRLGCDNIMLAKMQAECTERHGRWNPKRYVCLNAAEKYWLGVRALGLLPWLSWNGPPR